MRSLTLQKLSKEEYKEMSFIELAQHIFEEKKQAMPFNDLVDEIGSLLELKGAELRSRMLQFYTDLNVDGRFLSLGGNNWGMRKWYPLDQIPEEVVVPVKKKKKKAKKDVEEDFDDPDELAEAEEDYEDTDDEDEDDDDEEVEVSLEVLLEKEDDDEEDGVLLEEDDFELDVDEEEEEEEEEE